jgi:hypothetical protein
MTRICENCGKEYDDADCITTCPHALIMPRQDLDRKKQALSLMGKTVRFNHNTQALHIEAITWNGYICIAGIPGEFAPHLFTVIGD